MLFFLSHHTVSQTGKAQTTVEMLHFFFTEEYAEPIQGASKYRSLLCKCDKHTDSFLNKLKE